MNNKFMSNATYQKLVDGEYWQVPPNTSEIINTHLTEKNIKDGVSVKGESVRICKNREEAIKLVDCFAVKPAEAKKK